MQFRKISVKMKVRSMVFPPQTSLYVIIGQFRQLSSFSQFPTGILTEIWIFLVRIVRNREVIVLGGSEHTSADFLLGYILEGCCIIPTDTIEIVYLLVTRQVLLAGCRLALEEFPTALVEEAVIQIPAQRKTQLR